MKTIVVIESLTAGGAEGQVVQLTAELARRGESVEIVTYNPGNDYADSLREHGVRHVRIRGRGLFRMKRIRLLAGHFTSSRPDIVHAFGAGASLNAQLAGKLAGLPCVYSGYRARCKPGLLVRLAHRTLCPHPVGWIVNSIWVKESVVRHFCVRPEEVHIVPNVLSPHSIESALSRSEARELFTLDETGFVVSIIANLRPVKNHPMFIRMAKRVLDWGIPAVFLVAGDGLCRQELEDLTEKLDMRGRIRFVGCCENIPDLLRATDVVVLTSTSEGLPNALLEASGAGVPCVSTDNGGASEVIVEGRTGYIVPLDDDEAMADRVRMLLENDSMRAKMGSEARRLVTEKFTLAAGADILLKIYRSGCNRSTLLDRPDTVTARPKDRVLHVGPLPPPIGGIGMNVQRYLRSRVADVFDIDHLKVDFVNKTAYSGLTRRALNVMNAATLTEVFLWMILRDRHPLVHLRTSSYTGFYEKSLLAVLARLLGLKVIMHIHGGAFADFYGGSSRVLKWLIRRLLLVNHRVIAISEQMREVLLATGLPPERICVIENAVFPPDKTVLDRPNRCKSLDGAETKLVRIIFLNRIDHEKGIMEFVEAGWQVCRDHPHVECLIYGPETSICKTIRDRISAADMTGRIRLEGPVVGQAKEEAYLSADIYVLPSYVEGMPNGLLEAMSYGLACIATPVGGIPDMIKDGLNGMLAPVRNAGALAGAMNRLVADDGFRHEIGLAARRTIDEKHNWNFWAGEIIRLYSDLLILQR